MALPGVAPPGLRVHLNGQLIPYEQATVSVFDRGFILGDGIYEGLRLAEGELIGLDLHVERMRQGMKEMRLDRADHPFDPAQLGPLSKQLAAANGFDEAFIYWQVTRGSPSPGEPLRTRLPLPSMRQTVFAYALPAKAAMSYDVPDTRTAAICTDTRWLRGHVKSISLLGGVIGAIEADEQHADDAIFVRDGLVTEGTATNVFLVPKGSNRIVTPSLGSAPMLGGITRMMLLKEDPTIEQRPVTEAELRYADEIMLAGTLTMIAAITKLDARPVGDAERRGFTAGPHAIALMQTLKKSIRKDLDQAKKSSRQKEPSCA